MRLIALFVLALFWIALSVSANATEKAPTPGTPGYVAEDLRLTQLVGSPGPVVALQALDGSLIDLADTYGKKPIYLKVWATYCIPCRIQMPKFEKIYESVGDRIQVISVNAGVGDDAAKVTAFVAKTGLRMPTAIDDGSLSDWLKMQETPTHLLIGRDGRVAFAGHQDGAELDAAIQRVLESPTSTTHVKEIAVKKVAALKVGDAVPAMTLIGPDGRKVQFKDGPADHPRALLFTAIWCEDYLKQIEPQTVESCQRTRKEIAKLAQSGSVQWLGIVTHLWTTPDELAQYLNQTGQQLPYAVDTDGTAFRVFGIRRFPAVALIDAKGRLQRVVGPDDTDLAAAVASLDQSK